MVFAIKMATKRTVDELVKTVVVFQPVVVLTVSTTVAIVSSGYCFFDYDGYHKNFKSNKKRIN